MWLWIRSPEGSAPTHDSARHCTSERRARFEAFVRLASAAIVCAVMPSGAEAQSGTSCPILCSPSVTVMPAVIRSHLFGGPRVRSLATGALSRLPGSSNFEAILVVSARTALPRLGVFTSTQWLPNASAARNPYTLYTASDLGESVRANSPSATFGLSLTALPATATGGWLDLSGVVADLFSQSARPNDASAYTHKLDLELLAHLHAFAWAPESSYLRSTSVFAILDYVATGLPGAGDEVPKGRVFVTRARPAALIAGLALPIVPEGR